MQILITDDGNFIYVYLSGKKEKKCKGYRQTNTIAIIKYIEGVYIFFLILFENSLRARGTHFCVCVFAYE